MGSEDSSVLYAGSGALRAEMVAIFLPFGLGFGAAAIEQRIGFRSRTIAFETPARPPGTPRDIRAASLRVG
ncbi:hypothetical protein GCM10027089_43520 [Nocardia thraciensis]